MAISQAGNYHPGQTSRTIFISRARRGSSDHAALTRARRGSPGPVASPRHQPQTVLNLPGSKRTIKVFWMAWNLTGVNILLTDSGLNAIGVTFAGLSLG